MIFQYYSETDMLYIGLSMGVSVESEEVAAGIVLDFDASNKVISAFVPWWQKRFELRFALSF